MLGTILLEPCDADDLFDAVHDLGELAVALPGMPQYTLNWSNPSRMGHTLLHAAVRAASENADHSPVKMLLDAGATVNVQAADGCKYLLELPMLLLELLIFC